MKRVVLFFLVLAPLASPRPALADILWQWQFAGTEGGTFTTDGDLADLAIPQTLTILDFSVTASSVPAMIGAAYVVDQPTQGLEWDGTQITEFFRASGAFTNGSNFRNPVNDFSFGLNPAQACLDDDQEEAVVCAEPTYTPLADVPVMPPLLLTALAALLVAWALRKVARGMREGAIA